MKKIKICPICGKEHTKRRSQCCCIEHSQELSRRNHIRKPIITKICPKCGTHHQKPGLYCSRHCANGREQTPEIRKRKSQSIKRYLISIGKEKKEQFVSYTCFNCNCNFTSKTPKKYCSDKCRIEATRHLQIAALEKGRQTMKMRGNLGGYREGSGKAKTGYYKGIYCGSTYELVWVIYQLDNKREFSRFKGILEWDGVKYIPDFLQDGKIIEIKGYENPILVDKKTNVANHCGYEVIVLRKQDLIKEFTWVKEHYQYKYLQELYDDYKPIVYICDNCGKEFSKAHISNEKHKFCSRKCAGQYASKRLHGAIE